MRRGISVTVGPIMAWLVLACGGGTVGTTAGADGSIEASGADGALASPEGSAGPPDGFAGSPDVSAGPPDGFAGSPDVSAGPPDGFAGSPDVSAGSPDGAPGLCNDVPLPTRSAQVQLVGGGAPMPSFGGAIHDGLYELESALVYVAGSDGGTSIESRAHAILISSRGWASASYFDSAPTARYNDEATLSGNSVSLRRVCGDAASGILFGAQGTYSASDSTLVLNFPAGAAFGNGAALLAFRRLPGGDAGGGGVIGKPCANSYGCSSVDGGAPPFGIACGASGTCEACITNGLNDPCLGRPASYPQGTDCCAGLRCVNLKCIL